MRNLALLLPLSRGHRRGLKKKRCPASRYLFVSLLTDWTAFESRLKRGCIKGTPEEETDGTQSVIMVGGRRVPSSGSGAAVLCYTFPHSKVPALDIPDALPILAATWDRWRNELIYRVMD
ncbi:hypothetical protein HZH68_002842 [Vespula germanica]|uniref:Uncharacterized protein n=2 Tax=Vespula TaxID=7451 RepID=A0A834NN27_VESGE|nr:hypothetical protein HZH68_002842 [Vespula germanica]KAF7434565.1 hypothetical protein H0235_002756 [Vespula pensylvanica]